MSLLLLLLKPLFKSEGRGLLMMMAQELLVLKLRSLGKTSLKHQPLTTHLLLFPRGKGESSIIKDAASEADAMKWDEEVEERSAKKKQSSDT